jgi:hypothetical protein
LDCFIFDPFGLKRPNGISPVFDGCTLWYANHRGGMASRETAPEIQV